MKLPPFFIPLTTSSPLLHYLAFFDEFILKLWALCILTLHAMAKVRRSTMALDSRTVRDFSDI